ncbi:uncharacterized protein LOC128671026 [Plodia interpunctella]|uniref:uncharacterized protein LOC128671026 n=1 Tax=Plodia interpunctella TaxID=58824 RepID=UPI0023686D3B|nr:uncharacterized protein LOC128671026 [Plodia interpunctella]
MKPHPTVARESCSFSLCLDTSQSECPSLKRFIKSGSKTENLFYDNTISLRERKLIEKLVETRAIYDDVRNQLLSGRNFNNREKMNLRLNASSRDEVDEIRSGSAIVEIVSLMDKEHGICPKKASTYQLKSGDYSDLKKIKCIFARGDSHFSSRLSVLSVMNPRKRRRHRSRRLQFKQIRSDPCTCTLKSRCSKPGLANKFCNVKSLGQSSQLDHKCLTQNVNELILSNNVEKVVRNYEPGNAIKIKSQSVSKECTIDTLGKIELARHCVRNETNYTPYIKELDKINRKEYNEGRTNIVEHRYNLGNLNLNRVQMNRVESSTLAYGEKSNKRKLYRKIGGKKYISRVNKTMLSKSATSSTSKSCSSIENSIYRLARSKKSTPNVNKSLCTIFNAKPKNGGQTKNVTENQDLNNSGVLNVAKICDHKSVNTSDYCSSNLCLLEPNLTKSLKKKQKIKETSKTSNHVISQHVTSTSNTGNSSVVSQIKCNYMSDLYVSDSMEANKGLNMLYKRKNHHEKRKKAKSSLNFIKINDSESNFTFKDISYSDKEEQSCTFILKTHVPSKTRANLRNNPKGNHKNSDILSCEPPKLLTSDLNSKHVSKRIPSRKRIKKKILLIGPGLVTTSSSGQSDLDNFPYKENATNLHLQSANISTCLDHSKILPFTYTCRLKKAKTKKSKINNHVWMAVKSKTILNDKNRNSSVICVTDQLKLDGTPVKHPNSLDENEEKPTNNEIMCKRTQYAVEMESDYCSNIQCPKKSYESIEIKQKVYVQNKGKLEISNLHLTQPKISKEITNKTTYKKRESLSSTQFLDDSCSSDVINKRYENNCANSIMKRKKRLTAVNTIEDVSSLKYFSTTMSKPDVIGACPLLKRCFCTMNIQIPNYKHNMGAKSYLNKLKPYECEPGICIPGECNPLVCLKTIRKRLRRQCSNKTETKINSKSVSTNTIRINSQAKCPHHGMMKPLSGIKYSSSPNRKQAVRIGSTFRFNIEFSKTKLETKNQGNLKYINQGLSVHSKPENQRQKNTPYSVSTSRKLDTSKNARIKQSGSSQLRDPTIYFSRGQKQKNQLQDSSHRNTSIIKNKNLHSNIVCKCKNKFKSLNIEHEPNSPRRILKSSKLNRSKEQKNQLKSKQQKNRSQGLSRQVVNIGSNFSFNIEFYKKSKQWAKSRLNESNKVIGQSNTNIIKRDSGAIGKYSQTNSAGKPKSTTFSDFCTTLQGVSNIPAVIKKQISKKNYPRIIHSIHSRKIQLNDKHLPCYSNTNCNNSLNDKNMHFSQFSKQRPNSHIRKKEAITSNLVSDPTNKNQVVRIGSTFSFDITFYKDVLPNSTDLETAAKLLCKSKNYDTNEYKIKELRTAGKVDQISQVSKTMMTQERGVNTFSERHLCILKLKNRNKFKAEYSENLHLNKIDKGVMTQTCHGLKNAYIKTQIPNKCKCKKKRNESSLLIGENKRQKAQKYSNCYIEPTRRNKSSRQVVRIKSSHSFNVEFYKQRSHNEDDQPTMYTHPCKICKKTKDWVKSSCIANAPKKIPATIYDDTYQPSLQYKKLQGISIKTQTAHNINDGKRSLNKNKEQHIPYVSINNESLIDADNTFRVKCNPLCKSKKKNIASNVEAQTSLYRTECKCTKMGSLIKKCLCKLSLKKTSNNDIIAISEDELGHTSGLKFKVLSHRKTETKKTIDFIDNEEVSRKSNFRRSKLQNRPNFECKCSNLKFKNSLYDNCPNLKEQRSFRIHKRKKGIKFIMPTVTPEPINGNIKSKVVRKKSVQGLQNSCEYYRTIHIKERKKKSKSKKSATCNCPVQSDSKYLQVDVKKQKDYHWCPSKKKSNYECPVHTSEKKFRPRFPVVSKTPISSQDDTSCRSDNKNSVTFGSCMSFNIDFYKERTNNNDVKPYLESKTTLGTNKIPMFQRKRCNNCDGDKSYSTISSQSEGIKLENKGTSVMNTLKRCFCTLNIRKDAHQNSIAVNRMTIDDNHKSLFNKQQNDELYKRLPREFYKNNSKTLLPVEKKNLKSQIVYVNTCKQLNFPNRCSPMDERKRRGKRLTAKKSALAIQKLSINESPKLKSSSFITFVRSCKQIFKDNKKCDFQRDNKQQRDKRKQHHLYVENYSDSKSCKRKFSTEQFDGHNVKYPSYGSVDNKYIRSFPYIVFDNEIKKSNTPECAYASNKIVNYSFSIYPTLADNLGNSVYNHKNEKGKIKPMSHYSNHKGCLNFNKSSSYQKAPCTCTSICNKNITTDHKLPHFSKISNKIINDDINSRKLLKKGELITSGNRESHFSESKGFVKLEVKSDLSKASKITQIDVKPDYQTQTQIIQQKDKRINFNRKHLSESTYSKRTFANSILGSTNITNIITKCVCRKGDAEKKSDKCALCCRNKSNYGTIRYENRQAKLPETKDFAKFEIKSNMIKYNHKISKTTQIDLKPDIQTQTQIIQRKDKCINLYSNNLSKLTYSNHSKRALTNSMLGSTNKTTTITKRVYRKGSVEKKSDKCALCCKSKSKYGSQHDNRQAKDFVKFEIKSDDHKPSKTTQINVKPDIQTQTENIQQKNKSINSNSKYVIELNNSKHSKQTSANSMSSSTNVTNFIRKCVCRKADVEKRGDECALCCKNKSPYGNIRKIFCKCFSSSPNQNAIRQAKHPDKSDFIKFEKKSNRVNDDYESSKSDVKPDIQARAKNSKQKDSRIHSNYDTNKSRYSKYNKQRSNNAMFGSINITNFIKCMCGKTEARKTWDTCASCCINKGRYGAIRNSYTDICSCFSPYSNQSERQAKHSKSKKKIDSEIINNENKTEYKASKSSKIDVKPDILIQPQKVRGKSIFNHKYSSELSLSQKKLKESRQGIRQLYADQIELLANNCKCVKRKWKRKNNKLIKNFDEITVPDNIDSSQFSRGDYLYPQKYTTPKVPKGSLKANLDIGNENNKCACFHKKIPKHVVFSVLSSNDRSLLDRSPKIRNKSAVNSKSVQVIYENKMGLTNHLSDTTENKKAIKGHHRHKCSCKLPNPSFKLQFKNRNESAGLHNELCACESVKSSNIKNLRSIKNKFLRDAPKQHTLKSEQINTDDENNINKMSTKPIMISELPCNDWQKYMLLTDGIHQLKTPCDKFVNLSKLPGNDTQKQETPRDKFVSLSELPCNDWQKYMLLTNDTKKRESSDEKFVENKYPRSCPKTQNVKVSELPCSLSSSQKYMLLSEPPNQLQNTCQINTLKLDREYSNKIFCLPKNEKIKMSAINWENTSNKKRKLKSIFKSTSPCPICIADFNNFKSSCGKGKISQQYLCQLNTSVASQVVPVVEKVSLSHTCPYSVSINSDDKKVTTINACNNLCTCDFPCPCQKHPKTANITELSFFDCVKPNRLLVISDSDQPESSLHSKNKVKVDSRNGINFSMLEDKNKFNVEEKKMVNIHTQTDSENGIRSLYEKMQRQNHIKAKEEQSEQKMGPKMHKNMKHGAKLEVIPIKKIPPESGKNTFLKQFCIHCKTPSCRKETVTDEYLGKTASNVSPDLKSLQSTKFITGIKIRVNKIVDKFHSDKNNCKDPCICQNRNGIKQSEEIKNKTKMKEMDLSDLRGKTTPDKNNQSERKTRNRMNKLGNESPSKHQSERDKANIPKYESERKSKFDSKSAIDTNTSKLKSEKYRPNAQYETKIYSAPSTKSYYQDKSDQNVSITKKYNNKPESDRKSKMESIDESGLKFKETLRKLKSKAESIIKKIYDRPEADHKNRKSKQKMESINESKLKSKQSLSKLISKAESIIKKSSDRPESDLKNRKSKQKMESINEDELKSKQPIRKLKSKAESIFQKSYRPESDSKNRKSKQKMESINESELKSKQPLRKLKSKAESIFQKSYDRPESDHKNKKSKQNMESNTSELKSKQTLRKPKSKNESIFKISNDRPASDHKNRKSKQKMESINESELKSKQLLRKPNSKAESIFQKSYDRPESDHKNRKSKQKIKSVNETELKSKQNLRKLKSKAESTTKKSYDRLESDHKNRKSKQEVESKKKTSKFSSKSQHMTKNLESKSKFDNELKITKLKSGLEYKTYKSSEFKKSDFDSIARTLKKKSKSSSFPNYLPKYKTFFVLFDHKGRCICGVKPVKTKTKHQSEKIKFKKSRQKKENLFNKKQRGVYFKRKFLWKRMRRCTRRKNKLKRLKEKIFPTKTKRMIRRLKKNKKKVASLPVIRTVIRKLEEHPLTNYMLHYFDKDSNRRWRPRQKVIVARKEPVDFQCNLYMASIRKKPWLSVYYLCPWFYPHCISFVNFWKQFTNIVLITLAVVVWTPCFLAVELCRGLMCCVFCTG